MLPGPRYEEFAPPAHLVGDVECLWVVDSGAGHPGYRVLPDGCMDVVVQPRAGGAVRLEVVGAMTRHQEIALGAGRRVLGLRFRPGMGYRYLPLPADELADRAVPLDEVGASWGAALSALGGRLAETGPAAEALRILSARLAPRLPVGPVQRLSAWLAAAHGQVRADEMAAQANLSGRQLRRLFAAQVGLGPKQLARILRFQRAVALAHGAARPDWAGIAADCGYADQAHLVHEFGALAGCSPGRFDSRTANQVAGASAGGEVVAVSYNPFPQPVS